MKHLKVVVFAALTILTISSQTFAAEPASADAAKTEPAKQETATPEMVPPATVKLEAAPYVMSEEEFQKQRPQALADLAQRIKVFQRAHTCMKAAKTPKAFMMCNEELRNTMMAHINKKPAADGQK